MQHRNKCRNKVAPFFMAHYAKSMRFLISLLLMSTAALAQSQSPMMIVQGSNAAPDQRPASEIEHERVLNNFPDWAVTRAGAATGGSDADIADGAPAAPTPEPSPAPKGPETPAAPAAPQAPISKLWPADTVPIFVKSCVGFEAQKLVPCNCVIGKLMLAMPHDEFLKLSAQGTIEQDARLQNIRIACAVEAAKK